MIIKRIIPIITLFFLSCQDPSTVNADRDSSIDRNPDPNSPFLISNVSQVDFGIVNYDSIPRRQIIYTNVSGKEYTINDIKLEISPSPYKLSFNTFPITLQSEESLLINVDCRRDFSGEFNNIILVDAPRADEVVLKSNAYDLHIGTSNYEPLLIGDIGNRSFNIINYSNNIITIDSISKDIDHYDAFDFADIIHNEIIVLPGAENAVRIDYQIQGLAERLFISRLKIHTKDDIFFNETISISELVVDN